MYIEDLPSEALRSLLTAVMIVILVLTAPLWLPVLLVRKLRGDL